MAVTNEYTMSEHLRPVINVDSTKCCNCHRCISVCPVKMCNNGSGNYVSVNHDLCIGCGTCLDACVHGARTGIDDMEQFFQDLKKGTPIVAIVAPAVVVNFKGKDLELNGYLKSIGVKAVFDVSFGAELTTKSYVEQIKNENPLVMVSQPCPALVTFIETYRPQLIKYLAKPDSPMAHTAECIRHFYPEYSNCKIAAISPCFAKRREFDENGRVDYNVTMKNLDIYFNEHGIKLSDYPKTEYDNPPAERAVLYSTPGGLMRTAERFVPGISAQTRKIEGQPAVFEYLSGLDKSLSSGVKPYYKLVDCLNCEKGCNRGGGTTNNNMPLDELESFVESRANERRRIWNTQSNVAKSSAFKKLDKTVSDYWKPGIYERKYKGRSAIQKNFIKRPSSEQLQEIFNNMEKRTKADLYNCGACGYNSCEQMAVAIFNGLNRKENCHHYVLYLVNKEHDQKISETVSSITKESIKLLEGTKTNVESLTKVTETMTQNVAASSSAIEDMVSNISTINNIVDTNFKIVNELEDATQTGRTKLTEVDKLVGDIEKESSALMKMSSSIQKIASQTNMLAMNAAIEAAHAGEFGAGFSVVADEIRKLAEDSGREAKQIGEVLKKIKGMVDGAYDKSNEVSSEFENVVSLMENVKTHEMEVKTSMQKQNAGNEQLLNTLAQMKEGARVVEAAASHLSADTKNIIEAVRDIGKQK